MMGRLKSEQAQLFYQFQLDDAVPEDHLVRKIDTALDLFWLLAPHLLSPSHRRHRTRSMPADCVPFSLAACSQTGNLWVLQRRVRRGAHAAAGVHYTHRLRNDRMAVRFTRAKA